VSQHKECIYKLGFEFRGEGARRAHQNSSHTQSGASRLLNTLEGKGCARESTTRVVEDSESSARRALRKVQLCTSELYFEFREKRSVKEKTPQSY
jgi:hypothetical protein